MELSNSQKIYILNQHLDTISGIADKEYQKRVWIRGEGPECDDFDETICVFFDDGDPILDDYKEYGITDKQYKLLIEFRDAFDKFCRKNENVKLFIDSPEWKKIMDMAQIVLNTFNYKKTS